MFKATCLLLFFSVASLAQTQTPAGRTDTKRNKTLQELQELTFNECEAVLENHTLTLERIWATEFTMRTADGKTTPKAGARAHLRTALPQSISGLCSIEFREIKISGGKVEMSGQMKVGATASDGTFQPVQFRFGQRLVRREGRWQVVFLEFSPDAP